MRERIQLNSVLEVRCVLTLSETLDREKVEKLDEKVTMEKFSNINAGEDTCFTSSLYSISSFKSTRKDNYSFEQLEADIIWKLDNFKATTTKALDVVYLILSIS